MLLGSPFECTRSWHRFRCSSAFEAVLKCSSEAICLKLFEIFVKSIRSKLFVQSIHPKHSFDEFVERILFETFETLEGRAPVGEKVLLELSESRLRSPKTEDSPKTRDSLETGAMLPQRYPSLSDAGQWTSLKKFKGLLRSFAILNGRAYRSPHYAHR